MYQDWKVKRMKEVAEYYKEKMVGRRYRHFKGSLYGPMSRFSTS